MSGRATRSSTRSKAEKPAKAPAAAEKPAKSKRRAKPAEEDVEEQEPPHELFMKEIAQREKRLQKHCIIMEMVDTEEDETTLDQLRALKRVFVPEQVQADFIEVWSELDEVGQSDDEDNDEGEGDEGDEAEEDENDAAMKAFMKMFLGKCLQTRHGAEMQTILSGHLDFIDKSIESERWQAAFCRWVATVMAARREPHWWEDTDVPDDALDVYDRLRLQWIKLKEIPDEELGGLVSEMEGVDVKTELGQYLQDMADEMKQMDYEVQDVVQKATQQKKGKAKKQNAAQQEDVKGGRKAQEKTKQSTKKKSSGTQKSEGVEPAEEKVVRKRRVQADKQEQPVQETKQKAKKQKTEKAEKTVKAAAQKPKKQQQPKQKEVKGKTKGAKQ